jgi:hypothetical protein
MTISTSDIKKLSEKSAPSKKAKAGNKVAKAKAISNVSRDRQIETTQEEFRRQNETDILSQIIQFERELGCQPGLLDLLCRFSRAEIDTVWDSLIWLYPDLMSKGTTTVPELVVA